MVERSAIAVADCYGKVEEKWDYAVLNDHLLRGVVQFPPDTLATERGFWDAYTRFCKRIIEILGKRGVSPENRVHFAEEQLDKLGGSMFQLARVVQRGKLKNPQWKFATSPYLDVRYGIDLMRAWPEWNAERKTLDIFLTVYQAKASRYALRPEQVREAAERYGEQAERVKKELEFDPDWVSNTILGETDPITLRNLELAMNDLGRAREVLGDLTKEGGTAFERWRSAYVRGQLVGRFAEALGTNADSLPAIRQRGASVSFRFIVDTAKGLEDLTEEQARSYGKAA